MRWERAEFQINALLTCGIMMRHPALHCIGRLPVLILWAKLIDAKVHAEETRLPRIAGFVGSRTTSFVAGLFIGLIAFQALGAD
jgi:hypothetical protein